MAQLQKKFIAPNAIDESKIKLSNNSNLKARNAADSADVNILKVNASDKIEFASVPQVSSDPSAANDLVRKSYVDAVAEGLKPKQAVRVASTANVSIANGLENGDTVDGITLVTGDRVLLKDQSTASQNGIYVVVASGAASRSSDFDSLSPIDEINGAYTFVQEGTANAGKGFVQTGIVATLGTDPVTFVFFNSAASLVGLDMVTVSGNDISVDLAAVSGLESSNPGNAGGQLRVKLEASNPTLKIDGSNQLAAKLDAAGAVATGASGLKVNLEASNPSLQISSNELGVKLGNGLDKGASGLFVDTYRHAEITLGAGDITNQYYDLAVKLIPESSDFVTGGLSQSYGIDWDIDNSGSVSRVRWDSTNLPSSDLATGGASALVSGDKLYIKGIRV